MTLSISLPFLGDSLPLPLHAPDGFFSLPVAVAGYVAAAVFIGIAIRQTNKNLNERIVPMMGVMAAFIFAAQMLNFPVAGGTSGHLIGGALAAIILGPWAAILVMTAVVGLQALLFQDGGLVVLGINLLNMSIMSVLAGYGAYWVFRKLGTSFKHLMIGGFIAAWVSVVISAASTALMLGMSGTTPLALALPAMTGVHMLIGIGEGLITVFALSFIHAARPALLQAPAKSAESHTAYGNWRDCRKKFWRSMVGAGVYRCSSSHASRAIGIRVARWLGARRRRFRIYRASAGRALCHHRRLCRAGHSE